MWHVVGTVRTASVLDGPWVQVERDDGGVGIIYVLCPIDGLFTYNGLFTYDWLLLYSFSDYIVLYADYYRTLVLLLVTCFVITSICTCSLRSHLYHSVPLLSLRELQQVALPGNLAQLDIRREKREPNEW